MRGTIGKTWKPEYGLGAIPPAPAHGCRVCGSNCVNTPEFAAWVKRLTAADYAKLYDAAYWFFQMVQQGGPDGSELDQAVTLDLADTLGIAAGSNDL